MKMMMLISFISAIAGWQYSRGNDYQAQTEVYQAALIEAHKNYQAALDENIELKYCREFMWSTMLMANGEME